MKMFFAHKPASFKTFLMFFIAAFLVRAGIFYFYIQHQERYCQPDTQGYTVPALALYHGLGMSTPNGSPVFWRTPGYPIFLAPFFSLTHNTSWAFEHHESAYKAALWVQIIWCSLLPILLYLLAWYLTHSLAISYILAAIGVIHPGFVLASTFLLTDGPAQIFFVIFLICLAKALDSQARANSSYWHLAGAAVALSLYTWMRPMGQFVAIAALIILLFSSFSLQEKVKRSLFFLLAFSALIAPWFIRNHNLTGKIFFCPLFGLYFNVFNAPKIRARVENIPHELAWKKQCYEADQEILKERKKSALACDNKVIVNEMVCMRPAVPWMIHYPHYFIYDWIVEVIKTTFDLYSYQLVSLYHNTFKWDPLVEYLDAKLADTLYAKELPWYFRALAYLELIFSLFLWLGIFLSLGFLRDKEFRRKFFSLMFFCAVMIGAVVCQTGGFGYARLRLPIEPLIIIGGLVFWLWLYTKLSKKDGTLIRPVAK